MVLGELEHQPRPRRARLVVAVASRPSAGPGLDRRVDLDRHLQRLQLRGVIQPFERHRRFKRSGLGQLDDLELVDPDLVAEVGARARDAANRGQDGRDDGQPVAPGCADEHGGHADVEMLGRLALRGQRVVRRAAFHRPSQKIGRERPELAEAEQDGTDGVDVLGGAEVAGGAGVVRVQAGVVQLGERTAEALVDVAERSVDRDALVPAGGHGIAGLLEAPVDDADSHGRSAPGDSPVKPR